MTKLPVERKLQFTAVHNMRAFLRRISLQSNRLFSPVQTLSVYEVIKEFFPQYHATNVCCWVSNEFTNLHQPEKQEEEVEVKTVELGNEFNATEPQSFLSENKKLLLCLDCLPSTAEEFLRNFETKRKRSFIFFF